MADTINIAVVGGGRTGTPLLEKLSEKSFVNFIGIADMSDESPGMKLAAEKGIFTTNDPIDLAKKGEEIDLLIEVSGDPSVKPALKKYYTENGNKKTIIMHDLEARLLVSLVTDSDTLVESYHPDDVGIG